MASENEYSFVYRGVLTDEALDRTERKSKIGYRAEWENTKAERLGLGNLDDEFVTKSRKMSVVFVAITAFENTVRDFIEKTLLEEKGEHWWRDTVKQTIQNTAKSRMDSEKDMRWLSPRGSSPIYYVDFGDLIAIMSNDVNWPIFEPYLNDRGWAKQILMPLEKSRNIIMHGGILSDADVERVGMCIRDWINQVG